MPENVNRYCVDYLFYNEDNIPVQSLAFVFATSEEEAIRKVQGRQIEKIILISCNKYA